MKGAIIGDIVGSKFEWHNIKTKDFDLFGPHPTYHGADNQCFYTDDTVLTVATTDAILRIAPDSSEEAYCERFAEAYRRYTQNYPGRGYGGHFGSWAHDRNAGPYYSCGNGSAMRVSPVAWVARTLEECELLAKYSAEVTHNHPDGIAGAQATAGACWLGLHGASKDEIRAYVEKYYPLDFTLDKIRADYYFGPVQELNYGTVPYAVEAFLESTDFEDCIRNTMSIGGDSDTLGAIAGAIAEAFYGVPEELWEQARQLLDTELRVRIRFFYDYVEGLKNKN